MTAKTTVNTAILMGTLDWVREVFVDPGKAKQTQLKVSVLNRFNKVERFGVTIYGNAAAEALNLQEGSTISVDGSLASNKEDGVYIRAKTIHTVAPVVNPTGLHIRRDNDDSC
tara:strand:+ start:324 stop:662 length:339 start_codon:yes stop_codon:yes gene_type:complete